MEAGAYILLLLAISMLALLRQRGVLTWAALDQAPWRQTSLSGWDVLVALGLLFAGQNLLVNLGPSLGLVLQGERTPMDVIRGALLVQAFTQLPVVFYLIARLWQRHELRAAGLIPRRAGREIALGLKALLVMLPVVLATHLVSSYIAEQFFNMPAPKEGHTLLAELGRFDAWWQVALLSISAVIVAPVLEEFMFRGLLQSVIVQQLGPAARWMGLILASLIFTLVHWGAVPPQNLPGLFVLAMALGFVYESSGSLLPAIIMHAGFNAVNMLMFLLLKFVPIAPTPLPPT